MQTKQWLAAVAVAVALMTQVQAENTTMADESKPAATTMEAQPAATPQAKAVTPAAAPETTSALQVVEISIAPEIKDREPVGAADKFPATVGKLYCYTKIVGGTEGTVITHRWKKGNDVMAVVQLKVNGSPWRTFSSKSIMSDWTGAWSVEVLEGDKVLKTIDFTIE